MSTRNGRSIVEYFAENDGSRCGYCKSSNTNRSHGMWAHKLSVEDYQHLIDRGWRRSGCYCYKPIMDVTCCPPYTIRCAALEFNPSKSQKKIIKRFNRYTISNESRGYLNTDASSTTEDTEHQEGDASVMEWSKQAEAKVKAYSSASFDPSVLEIREGDAGTSEKTDDAPVIEPSSAVKEKVSRKAEDPNQSAPKQKKAKLLRKERKRMKLLDKGYSEEEADAKLKPKVPQGKSLEEFIKEGESSSPAHVLEIKLIGTNTAEFLKSSEESCLLYKKYQIQIHNDPPDEDFQETFTSFLKDTPIEPWKPQYGPPSGYGSFHQQYWLDGKLIAVGVLDILPKCISSVYFYYDPDSAFLSLGTYGSLREISMVRSLNLQVPSIQYYYMGFYIHSCPKMRYKANYKPSDLLCPEAYTWRPLEECKPKLDQQKYSRLNPDSAASDPDGKVNIDEVAVLYKRAMLLYGHYKKLNKHRPDDEDQEVLQYAKLVGQCSRSMLLYRSSA